ncbi:MAG: DUF882 domain-containing protein [Proteobacteria bacterium]|nr:DUF882 domain-containing protein [Pseudomonadota bacterium]
MATAAKARSAVLAFVFSLWAIPALADRSDTDVPAGSGDGDSNLPQSSLRASRVDSSVVPRLPVDSGERARPADPAGESRSKKARMLAAKQRAAAVDAERRQAERARWHRELDRRLGQPPARVVSIYNTWTHEYIALSGAVENLAKERLDGFFRCHFTNQPTDMDFRLFAALVAMARHFQASRVDIISGYRAPKYNLILRKKGREVAKRSRHSLGHAVDFRIPGVSVRRLFRRARQLGLGGVGYYPNSGFIHIDVGPVRRWTGR